MAGNIIFLVFCMYQNKDKVLQAPHDTFEGAQERIENEKEYYKAAGYVVKDGIHGTLNVYRPNGEFFRHYYVVTRHIEK